MVASITRRQFILLSVAAFGTGSCGLVRDSSERPQLVPLFSPDHVIVAGVMQRIPLGVVGDSSLGIGGIVADGRLFYEGDLVQELSTEVRVVDHDHVDADIAPDHEHTNLLNYVAFRVEFPQPGIFDLEVTLSGGGTGSIPIQVFDRPDGKVLGVGDRFPAVASPTERDPAGVASICTRLQGRCPFHRMSIDQILAQGEPSVVLVATPALCSTAYCGPVLETLIEAAVGYSGVRFIHLEFYSNGDDGSESFDTNLVLAPVMREVGLEFEPSMFFVDKSGVIVDRIDNIFDGAELEESLQKLIGA